MQRRQFVAWAGTGMSVTLAGCSGLVHDREPAPKADVIESKFSKESSANSSYYYLRGLIKNTGAVPLHEPRALLNFYSKDGSIVANVTKTIRILNPGQVWACHTVSVPREEQPVKGVVKPYKLNVKYANYTPPSELNVSHVEFEPGETAEISGDITNTADTEISALVTAQFLNKHNYVIDTDSKRFILHPGETHSFTLVYDGAESMLTDPATGYGIFPDCYECN